MCGVGTTDLMVAVYNTVTHLVVCGLTVCYCSKEVTDCMEQSP